MRKRTWVSLYFQLITSSVMNLEFGTMTAMLSLLNVVRSMPAICTMTSRSINNTS